MNDLIFILFLHVALTWFLTGMIWFMQIVHYPLYKKIIEGFHTYSKKYIRRSWFLLAPLMLVEFVTGLFLFGLAKRGVFASLTGLNLGLIILIWFSTLLFQITQLQKLAIRFTPKCYQLLVKTNWIRTLLWSVRAILVIFLIYYLPK